MTRSAEDDFSASLLPYGYCIGDVREVVVYLRGGMHNCNINFPSVSDFLNNNERNSGHLGNSGSPSLGNVDFLGDPTAMSFATNIPAGECANRISLTSITLLLLHSIKALSNDVKLQ